VSPAVATPLITSSAEIRDTTTLHILYINLYTPRRQQNKYKATGLRTDHKLAKSLTTETGEWHNPLTKGILHTLYCWRRGVVVSVVRRMNEVTLRRARLGLVLRW